MSLKCLMLETSDRRRFFTALSCRKLLAEYCRHFNAKTHVVMAEIKRSDLTTMSNLVRSLCVDQAKKEKIEFRVMDVEERKRSRSRGR